MDVNLYYVTTRNCNIACDHCYASCGPKKMDTTVTVKNFEKSIDHLQKSKKTYLGLTGGEIFTIPRKLYDFLEIIQDKNRFRNRKIYPIIQTNAFWASSRSKMESVLEKLAFYGVLELDIASSDKFHSTQGLVLRRKKLLREIAEEKGVEVGFRGAEAKRIMPLGRAKKNFKLRYLDFDRSCANPLIGEDLTIHPNGSVYVCCFGFFKYPGNIFKESMNEILRRARKDPRFQRLHQRGIVALAEKEFGRRKARQLNAKHGNCGMCYALYGSKSPFFNL